MDSNADDVRSVESLNSSGHVQCGICKSSFRRPEHLKRHMRSHTKEKPFECNHCGRYFSRTDTLHRHSLSHHNSDIGGRRDRMHRITVKTFRACFSCAAARVRCSGGNPCERCTTRSFDCIYPTERRSKAKSQETLRPKSTAEERPEQRLFHVASQREPRNSPGGLSQVKPCSFQTIQFSINGNNTFIQESFGVDSFSNASELHGRMKEPGVELQMSAPRTSKHSLASSTPATAPSMICPGQGYLQRYQDKCYQTLPESSHDFPPEVEGPWLEIPNPGSFLHFNVLERAAATSDLDFSSFDESLLSTISWTPEDLEDNQSQVMHSFYSQSGPGISSTLWYPTMMLAGQRELLNIDDIPETSSGEESLCTDMDGSVIHFHGSHDLSLQSRFESRGSSNSLAGPRMDESGGLLPGEWR